ncbi:MULTISPECIES: hypothetical protein [unclassified Paenibacillus]|uniref:hypothetical protein n=1 Tax=unclassified Paenibacillus TaxID=185978 RepID=UPI00041896A3|nr:MULTISPECIES: hypothetical protein [unclassified Paenibacillus]KGP84620.1 hypothetical protein P364_0104200 [Paenibacillus sp. MAEPY2]KGP86787.1 hypothetical protein P363_0115870 [Paenibacillus sp. MAEPY1]
MKKKLFLIFVMVFSLFPSALYAEQDEPFLIHNVYQYDPETYDKIKSFDYLRIELLPNNELSFQLEAGADTLEIDHVMYERNVDEESNTTLISAEGSLDNGNSFILKLGYDQIENANGDLIITEVSDKDAFPKETFIRFNNNEWITLKEMHEGIQSDESFRVAEEPNMIGPLAANLPVVKSSKYGQYTFSNVQWNTTNLMTNNANNLQVKFQPLFSNLNTWKAPNGSTGQLIKKQSEIFTILTRYESLQTTAPYVIAYTYPIVRESNQRTIPIALSYSGIGTEIQIPVGSKNTKVDGARARWDLNDISIPLQDSQGRDLDKYTIQGTSSLTGKGNVKIEVGVYVKIGAFYSFANKPAQWTTFTDNYTHVINAKAQ